MSASPTTITPRAEICWPMPVRLEPVRKAGLTIEPTITSTTRAGSRATSRTTLIVAPRSPTPPSMPAEPARAVTAPVSVVFCMSVMASLAWPAIVCLVCADPLGGRDQPLAVVGRGDLAEHLAADEDHDAVHLHHVVK